MITDNLTELITVTQVGGGMKVGDWITLAAVIVALVIGVASIIQTQMLQKRERKERLLNEIIEWATEIHTASLKTDLPNIDPFLELYIEERAEGNQKILEDILTRELYRIQVETLFKHSIPYFRAGYIRALASGNFGGHGITTFVDAITDNLAAVMYLVSMKLGIANQREAFGKPAITIDEELKTPTNTVDNLFEKYAKQLSGSVNDLFKDGAKFISNL